MSDLTVLIHCADQKGIIAKTTDCIHQHNGNIVYIDQYVDRTKSAFFMRVACEFEDRTSCLCFIKAFKEGPSVQFTMSVEIYTGTDIPKMALFVSKYDHCLYDILSRYKSKEWQVHIPFIISNHPDLNHVADSFGIPFYHIPITKQTKAEAALKQLELLRKHQIDFIVLARYMQIVSPKLIDAYPNAIINIHHSFLQAFPGAKPYHSAHERGVKIIGATSHYITDELDAGPIIQQDVASVTHSNSIDDLVTKGRDLEKIVLSRAIKLHLQHKVMVYGNRTIVFN